MFLFGTSNRDLCGVVWWSEGSKVLWSNSVVTESVFLEDEIIVIKMIRIAVQH
jgi:hypothetical protein